MKTTLIATTLSLLLTTTTTALALPNIRPPTTYPLATLQLSNDISGANALRSLPANAVPTTFLSLFAGSALVQNGGVLKATSLQNVAPGSGVRCEVRRNGSPGEEVVGSVDGERTWVDLDGDRERSVEMDVGGWTVVCE